MTSSGQTVTTASGGQIQAATSPMPMPAAATNAAFRFTERTIAG
jgi:hypothetical protein